MKNLFTILFTFALCSASIAQVKGNVELGVGIGYNSSTVSTSDDAADGGSGLNVTGSADYYFSDRWSIKTKVIYDQKGWNNGFIETPEGTFVTDVNLDYLTVPVMANWHFGKKRNWYLNFGPYVGFLLSAKETEFDMDLKEGFNSTDFGLALGIGVKIPVSQKIKIYFEFDGQGGFSNIFKESILNVQNTRSSFNAGINFILK